MNGKEYELPPDWDELEEIDYNDPEVRKWMADREAESIRLYGKLTSAEADFMYSRRLELQEQFPQKSAVELNQQALKEFRSR